jgi:hypothetical protein
MAIFHPTSVGAGEGQTLRQTQLKPWAADVLGELLSEAIRKNEHVSNTEVKIV